MDFFRRDLLGRGQSSPPTDAVESQSPSPDIETQSTPQLEEQSTRSPHTNTRTRRFSISRPTLPSLLRGRANAAAGQQSDSSPEMIEHPEINSPKTPTNRYTLTLSNFSSSRLDLPHLSSPTSTDGLRSPTSTLHDGRNSTFSAHLRSPTIQTTASTAFTSASVPDVAPRSQSRLSRLSDAPPYPVHEVIEDPVIARPTPAVQAERRRTIRFEGVEPGERRVAQESQLDLPREEEATEGRWSRFQRHRSRQRRQQNHYTTTSTDGQPVQGVAGPRSPKHFLFCFPWIKSQRIRNQILTCFVSGVFLVLMLTVYLALTLTHQIASSQFAILIILIILFTTIIFCHALIRLCLYVVKPRTEEQTERNQMSHFVAPGGYAIPRRPIRVVLARDEEAAGIDNETMNVKPPAYGLWRESVRVDPNRIYWQRNEEGESGDSSTSTSRSGGAGSSSSGGSSSDERSPSPRPPSYISDDGINYVVDARPRSMAPTTDVPLPPHPSEAGNRGQSPAL
ncbi:uncharacterized protein MKZ38_003995 [Zalerion maritima]|uniref:Uncharacterized protein n=1 Tax=Zalerion maritima TaxID=339359 RepID=A0AAD5RNF0_9PEZI|nr:uncharacterized protein MKZ38_003995 [Zalerion maritima]